MNNLFKNEDFRFMKEENEKIKNDFLKEISDKIKRENLPYIIEEMTDNEDKIALGKLRGYRIDISDRLSEKNLEIYLPSLFRYQGETDLTHISFGDIIKKSGYILVFPEIDLIEIFNYKNIKDESIRNFIEYIFSQFDNELIRYYNK